MTEEPVDVWIVRRGVFGPSNNVVQYTNRGSGGWRPDDATTGLPRLLEGNRGGQYVRV